MWKTLEALNESYTVAMEAARGVIVRHVQSSVHYGQIESSVFVPDCYLIFKDKSWTIQSRGK